MRELRFRLLGKPNSVNSISDGRTGCEVLEEGLRLTHTSIPGARSPLHLRQRRCQWVGHLPAPLRVSRSFLPSMCGVVNVIFRKNQFLYRELR